MSSLLYVSVRPERVAADAEHESFRRALGFSSLDRVDLVERALEPGLLDDYAGFVVGGSPFNVTDEAKTSVQVRVERDLERAAGRALGGASAGFFTCFGIGVVTRFLGGVVDIAHPESVRATSIWVLDDSDPIFGPSAPELRVFTAHKEGSTEVPPGAHLLATNEDCPVQAYRAGASLYATQFHPEPTASDFAHRMGFYRETGYFDPAQFERERQVILDARASGGTDLLRRFGALFASASDRADAVTSAWPGPFGGLERFRL